LYRAITFEATVKLSVNVAVSIAAIATLVQLVPHLGSQQAKLQEVQAATRSASQRVQHNQGRFNYYFDASQTRTIMQEQTNRIDPNRRQIIWEPVKR
jgi:hypothetical protein